MCVLVVVQCASVAVRALSPGTRAMKGMIVLIRHVSGVVMH